eukprot:scaffold4283_cov133-Chaetoceros_neogracile.AAC.1
MSTRKNSSRIVLHPGQECIEKPIVLVPSSDVILSKDQICVESITSLTKEKALILYKQRLYPIINKLRNAKYEGKKAAAMNGIEFNEDEYRWWFPTDEYSRLIRVDGKHDLKKEHKHAPERLRNIEFPYTTPDTFLFIRGRSLSDIIESTCCPKEPQDSLRSAQVGEEAVPKFVQFQCVETNNRHVPCCTSCGTRNVFKDLECCPLIDRDRPREGQLSMDSAYSCDTIVSDHKCSNGEPTKLVGEKTYKCRVWVTVKIQNSTSKQQELHELNLTWRQLHYRMEQHLKVARLHYVEKKRNSWAMKLLKTNGDPKKMCTILTDFAATVNLRADQTDNASVDGHAVLQVFMKYFGWKKVPYDGLDDEGDGIEKEHVLSRCESLQFIGPTKGKGKHSDHTFHRTCLRRVITDHERSREVELDEAGEPRLFTYFVVTDNCPNQYKCRHTFLSNAQITELFPNRKIRIVQVFAALYGFKGIHDAEGGTSKRALTQFEVNLQMRSETAFKAFINLSDHMSIDEWKLRNGLSVGQLCADRDWRIIQKSISSIDKRIYFYVTPNQADYENRRAEVENQDELDIEYKNRIMFVDRSAATLAKHDPGTGNHLVETTKNYCFIGPSAPDHFLTDPPTQQREVALEETVTNEPQQKAVYKIRYLRRTCGCLHCRTGIEEQCAFRNFTGPVKQQNLTAKRCYDINDDAIVEFIN